MGPPSQPQRLRGGSTGCAVRLSIGVAFGWRGPCDPRFSARTRQACAKRSTARLLGYLDQLGRANPSIVGHERSVERTRGRDNDLIGRVLVQPRRNL
jgi:hypothetical protein